MRVGFLCTPADKEGDDHQHEDDKHRQQQIDGLDMVTLFQQLDSILVLQMYQFPGNIDGGRGNSRMQGILTGIPGI
ncbi:hypothetical protein ACQ86N_37525 [Puia sp. P3]|uniref:hypothetical protein n=1 Tax=Puia sp. P3 TaxID=3423952 RepID=UPI003D67D3C6